MPISEVLDRYTITRLKSERTTEDVSEELKAYRLEIEKYSSKQVYRKQAKGLIEELTERLYRVNGKLWDTEAKAARDAEHDNPPLEEIGRLALEVRELNRERNGIKAEIVEEFCEGFKEIKVNYKKVDYGKKSVD